MGVVELGHGALLRAVLDAMPSMRVAPATIAGCPVRQLVQQPFVFNIAPSDHRKPERWPPNPRGSSRWP